MPDPVIFNRQRRYAVPLSKLRRFLVRLGSRLKIPEREFVVLLTNDRTMRRLNHRFRNKNRATDVLSFPSSASLQQDPSCETSYLGDIIISVERARRQAIERKHNLEKELRILMIHGVLHLLGHDHETDQGQMRRKELRLQREFL